MLKEVHTENIEDHAGATQILRLLALWRSLSQGPHLPRYEQLSPQELSGFAPNLAVVESIGEGDYRYIHYGSSIAAESGVEMLGSRVSEWKSEIGTFFCGAYNRSAAEQRPVYTVHRANHAARVHLWERIVLPTISVDGSLRLVVYNAPREYKEELLKTVFDTAPDGIMAMRCLRDDDNQINDALVLTVNERMAGIFGRAMNEILHKPLLQTLPKFRLSEIWSRCRDAIETGQRQQFEFHTKEAVREKWFNIRIVPVGEGATIAASDITELKESHQELLAQHTELANANALLRRQAKELRAAKKAATQARKQAEIAAKEAETMRGRLMTAFDVVREGLVLFDKDGRLVLWNQAYLDMYPKTRDVVAEGVQFEHILRTGLDRGQHLEAEGREGEWLQERLALQRSAYSTHVQQLPGGRWIRVEERQTPDGGSMGVRVDITELKRREQELEQQNARFDAALNNMSEGLCLFDGAERLIMCNRRYAEMYCLDPARVVPGTTLREIVAMRVEAGTCPDMAGEDYYRWRKFVGENGQKSHTVVELANGRTVEIHHQPMPDGGWVSTHEDITDRRRMEQHIVHMAHYDSLTELPNRALFLDTLKAALKNLQSGEQCAMLALDLDRFKDVNDTLGHGAGDTLLKAVAGRLKACVREGDLVARLGGDEFTILLAGADAQQASGVAHRIIEAIGKPFDVEGQQVAIGTSIGIAIIPQDGQRLHEILTNSDLALYRAKSEGRSVYRFFETAMNTKLQARRTLETELRDAIENGQLDIHYQPVLEFSTNSICACEALLRWHHPARGPVSPAEFIPIAEATGLIIPIGDWVLRRACRTAAMWPRNVKVAVNLSAVQFKSPDLIASIERALAEAGLDPARLELEITESLLLDNVDRTVETIKAIRRLGVHVALDDFGTGYSSLSYLRSITFDKIKVDRSFIIDLNDSNGTGLAILRAITELGRSLGMRVTAEGVETIEQMHCAQTNGCTEMQGFLFAPPVSELQLLAVMAERPAGAPLTRLRSVTGNEAKAS